MSAANAVGSQKRLPEKRKTSIVLKFWKTRFLFALFIPCLIYYILFKYVPMWGISLSMFEYSITSGMAGAKWAGLYNFDVLLNDPNFFLYAKNTLMLGSQGLVFTFPLTIIFSLLLNEVRHARFKKVTQTISYIPHFLSTVIVIGMLQTMTDPATGIINQLIMKSGTDPIDFFMSVRWFRPLYLITDIWSGLGWGTIIYLAAISGVDPGLYEAARLDGAGRFRQMINITLPSIAPTVSTMLILKVGHILGDSMEKVILMQHPTTYEVSNTLSSYNYYMGLTGGQNFGRATALGLMTSLVNLCLLLSSNWLSKKLTEHSIF